MEKYLAVIKVLESGDLVTQKQIMQEADLKLESPKEALDFLVNAQLIVEKKVGNKKVVCYHRKRGKIIQLFPIK